MTQRNVVLVFVVGVNESQLLFRALICRLATRNYLRGPVPFEMG